MDMDTGRAARFECAGPARGSVAIQDWSSAGALESNRESRVRVAFLQTMPCLELSSVRFSPCEKRTEWNSRLVAPGHAKQLRKQRLSRLQVRVISGQMRRLGWMQTAPDPASA
eukprot:6190193-Pleurochrysis_carterae.AAC.4